MGTFAPKGHAKVNARSPAAFAICDCCGFQYNHRDLRWQVQWAGGKIVRTGFLVCPTCYDRPNRTLAVALPPDPVPIVQPRSEASSPADQTLNPDYVPPKIP